MNLKLEPPKPPPMRCMQGYTWVNEWELVDWYTNNGKIYDRINFYEDRWSWSWFSNLFKRDYQIKLDKALSKNRMLCTEWPR